jgi:phosphatidylglycerophosphate synthase
MLLLPIPCALLFWGTTEKLVALGLFTLLALTDWWDGKLARKQGPTVLGGLLDPIADKMFLAFTWVPMACIEGERGSGLAIVPVWLTALIFFRELSVTGMRSMAAAHGIEFKTATLAKYKTAFQMAGGGFLFWDVIWQDDLVVAVAGNAAMVAIALGIALYRRLKGRGVGPKIWTQVGAYAGATLIVWFLPLRWALLILAVGILVLTLASGLQYVVRVVEGLRAKGWPASAGEVALCMAEAAIPIGVVSLVAMGELTVWAVIVMLTGELAAGGLIDLMTTRGARRRPWIAWLRCLAILLCGVAGWIGHMGVVPLPWLEMGAACAAAAVSGVYCAGLFVHHRTLYLH